MSIQSEFELEVTIHIAKKIKKVLIIDDAS